MSVFLPLTLEAILFQQKRVLVIKKRTLKSILPLFIIYTLKLLKIIFLADSFVSHPIRHFVNYGARDIDGDGAHKHGNAVDMGAMILHLVLLDSLRRTNC